MTASVQPRALRWRKSSNGDGGDCVEAVQTEAGLLLRVSKHPSGPVFGLGRTPGAPS